MSLMEELQLIRTILDGIDRMVTTAAITAGTTSLFQPMLEERGRNYKEAAKPDNSLSACPAPTARIL